MDLAQLKNFVALAQVLNFSTVARQAFISQPALTKQISRLEEELGVQLFRRTKHGVSLTYAGSEFYTYASSVVEDMAVAGRRMSDISRGHLGSLRIFILPDAEMTSARYISAFHRRYPEIRISLSSGTGKQQIMAINQSSHDIYFSFTSLAASFSGLESIPVEPERYVIYINREYVPDGELERGCLGSLPHLMESSAEGPFLIPQIEANLAALGCQGADTLYYPSTSTILVAVAAGLGFAVLPERLNLGVVPAEIVKLPLPGDTAVIENSVAWKRDTENIMVKKFIDIVRESRTEI